MSLEAARARLRIVGFTDEEIAALKEKGTVQARDADPRADRRHRHRPQGRSGPICAQRYRRGALHHRRSLHHVAQGAGARERHSAHPRRARRWRSRSAALPDRVFKARVTAIGAASDATTRRVVVRSEIPNPDGALKSEMFASFKIVTGADEPSPAVPVEAVIREGDARRRLGRGGADAVPAAPGDARDRAGGPRADPRGPQGRRAGRRAAARSSSTTSGGSQ